MTPAEHYRTLAAKLKAKAANESSKSLAAEWTQLAQSYLRLAEQADQNRLADVWIEIGPKPSLIEDAD
jgi:hypothetical protein